MTVGAAHLLNEGSYPMGSTTQKSFRWTMPIGVFGGTVIAVHFTFLLLVAWIGTVLWLAKGPIAAVDGVVFILALFACVVLHELGHATAARHYGIRTQSITLYPIGGLAALDRIPEAPAQEVVVALAGPAVNVVIALLLVALFGARIDTAALGEFGTPEADFLSRLATVNLLLAVFNMIPAFPMDGGRVLRALLGFRLPRAQATQIAARVGQIFAIALGFLGLLGNPVLVLIAVFVYIAAGTEAYSASLHDFARGRPVTDAMIAHFEALSPDSTLEDAAALLLSTTQREFPVLDHQCQLIGFVEVRALAESLAAHPKSMLVTAITTRDIPECPENAPLEQVVERLERGGAPAVAVVSMDRQVIGYVTLENLAEFFMIRSARDAARKTQSAAHPIL